MEVSILKIKSTIVNGKVSFEERPMFMDEYPKSIVCNSIIESAQSTKYMDNDKLDVTPIWNVTFMLVSLEILSNNYFLNWLVEYSKHRKFKDDNKYCPVPIVFVTALNYLPNYAEDDLEQRNNEVESKNYYFNFDKRLEFLDSSIWHYYLPIENWNNKSFKDNLQIILNNIRNNYILKLYDTNVAKEFIEFQSRTMRHSFLANIGGGHSDKIIPFVYHSETKVQYEISKIIVKIKDNFSKSQNKIQWNVLLIDDYSKQKLKGSDKTKSDIFNHIIKGHLRPYFNNIKLYVCEGIEEAVLKIKTGKDEFEEPIKFDVLLLDYLLGEKNGDKNLREYGDELLIKLETDDDLLKRKGPLGKFWILPISSFNTAMLSKLGESGIGRINDNWYIMDGADMINTPNLFIYNLLKLIELQLKTVLVSKADIVKFIMDNISLKNTQISLKTNNAKDLVFEVRQSSRRLYGIFMHKFGLRDALKSDRVQGSAFARSVLQYMNEERFEDLRFYENVRKLLYLVGFGTHNDAELMWDLLSYINSNVELEKEKFHGDDWNNIRIFLESVANYISELKKKNG